MTRPRLPALTPLVDGLPATVPFVGPEAQERDRGKVFRARIGANESVFGPSPHAIAAMEAAAREVWKYGDPENHDLKAALADHHGVAPANIVVGEGIDGLLGYLVRLFVGPGDAVVTSDGAYPTFNYHVAGFGGVLHKVPYRDDHEDPDALLETARAVAAKLIYLANPDNPMGTWHGAEVIEGMIDRVPDGALLVLDEAYADFALPETSPRIDTADPRVIRMRTFSKAYGMAGARVGYAIGHAATIDAFNRIRNHFGVSRIAQAGALAALADQDWLAEVVARTASARRRIAEIADRHDLLTLPSATNFMAIDCGGDGAFAHAVLTALLAESVFVRMPFSAPQNRCIRIGCGTDADLDILASALPTALDRARSA